MMEEKDPPWIAFAHRVDLVVEACHIYYESTGNPIDPDTVIDLSTAWASNGSDRRKLALAVWDRISPEG